MDEPSMIFFDQLSHLFINEDILITENVRNYHTQTLLCIERCLRYQIVPLSNHFYIIKVNQMINYKYLVNINLFSFLFILFSSTYDNPLAFFDTYQTYLDDFFLFCALNFDKLTISFKLRDQYSIRSYQICLISLF